MKSIGRACGEVRRRTCGSRAAAVIAGLTVGAASCAGPAGGRDSFQESFAGARAAMVANQIAARGVRTPKLLAVMQDVPRHLFVPADQQASAYDDRPLPIGHDQTISQPYIVALMTDSVRPQPGDRALEIGTGSGYQAAVLSGLVSHVYSIEIVEPLAREAERRLSSLGYANVTVRVGDGYAGWPEEAPFDIIIVTAAPDHVPQPLVDQLRPGGRLVVPVGSIYEGQELQLLEKDSAGDVRTRRIAAVAFVPLRRGEIRR